MVKHHQMLEVQRRKEDIQHQWMVNIRQNVLVLNMLLVTYRISQPFIYIYIYIYILCSNMFEPMDLSQHMFSMPIKNKLVMAMGM